MDAGNPVVMFKRGKVFWRYSGPDVFKRDGGLGGEPVFGDVGFEGGAEEGTVDKEVKWDRGSGGEKVVDDLGEAEALEAGDRRGLVKVQKMVEIKESWRTWRGRGWARGIRKCRSRG